METLRAHKESLEEMRSDQRDKAAAQYPFTPTMLEVGNFNACISEKSLLNGLHAKLFSRIYMHKLVEYQ